MIRMTFVSLLGHCLAAIGLLFLSWFQPRPKIKPPPRQQIHIEFMERTPVPTPKVIPKTPPPRTPRPSPTIVKPKKTAKPTERKKTPTPKPTKTRTPKPTKTRTPRPTPTKTPAPTKPPATPKPTQQPAQTPAPRVTPVWIQNELLRDYSYYRIQAQQKIESNFRLPKRLRAKGVTCLVRFTVMRDGTITQIQVIRSTGDPILDDYALRALKMTAKLPPLPDPLKVDYVHLNVLFDYAEPSQPNP